MELIEITLSILRVSTPLILAALGGLVCERSGVYQLALEAFILVGAFAAAAVAALTGSPILSLSAGIFAAVVVSFLQALWTIRLRTDAVVVGMALNLFCAGLVPVVNRTLFGVTTSTPTIPTTLNESILILVVLLILFHNWFLQNTFAGIWNALAGRSPFLLRTLGQSVSRVQLLSVLWSGVMGGLAGTLLSTWLASQFSRNMSAGRGFIALVAMIAGRYRPLPTVAFCLFFGGLDVLQMQIKAQGWVHSLHLPEAFFLSLPYALTLILLALRPLWKRQKVKAI